MNFVGAPTLILIDGIASATYVHSPNPDQTQSKFIYISSSIHRHRLSFNHIHAYIAFKIMHHS